MALSGGLFSFRGILGSLGVYISFFFYPKFLMSYLVRNISSILHCAFTDANFFGNHRLLLDSHTLFREWNPYFVVFSDLAARRLACSSTALDHQLFAGDGYLHILIFSYDFFA